MFCVFLFFVFFFKQKTAYEMRISDWSSDVCSSDLLNSGIHATIAGVVAALTIPMRGKDDDTMLEHMEHGLAPWSAYLIVPIFGFANAGVNISGIGVEGVLAPLPLAIAMGLFIGKPIGIFGAVFLAEDRKSTRLNSSH